MNDFSPFSTLPEPWKIWLSQPGVVAIITDTDGQILYISPSFEKIFSLSSKKYIGKRIQDFFHLPLSSWNIDKIGSTWLTNHAWLCIDNTWFWVYVEGIKPASFPWGNVILFLIHNLSPYLEEEAFFHFFKIFTERVEDAIFLMNRDIILACNESATSIFRTPTSQIIGRSVLDLSPPFQADGSSSKKLAYEYIQRALNGDIFSFTWIHSSADGSYTFPTRVNLSKVEFNNQSYLFAIVHDLKNENAWIEKIETQNELLQKINRYAVLFNLQPYEKILDTVVKFYEELFPGVLVIINKYDPIKKTFLIWHSNLALLHFKYFQRIINKKLEIYEVVLSEEDFQQIHAEKISPPITLEEATFHQIKPWQSKALSLLSGYRTFFSCLLISSDRLYGSILLGFKKNMTLPNRRDLETAVNLVSSVIANLVTQKQIEEENAQRQLILDRLPVFIGIYDQVDLVFVYANCATREIFGYDPHEVIGKKITSFVALEDLPRVKGIILNRSEGKNVGRYEARFVHKNGHLVWGSVDGVSIVYQGKPCVLLIIMDVTRIRELQEKLLSIEVRRRKELEIELEKIKKELIHASRLAAIGQVSSFIAHELKNPLSAAGNALFLLEKKTHMLPELQKYIHIARDELQSCFAVINSVLQLNRVRDPVMSQFDLALLLNNILERYFKHLPVELSYEFNPDPFFIQADQEQFNMVFQNLIKNSIESNPSGVRITVKGWVEEGKYKVLFCDDGVGIPEEYHSHIFDPLFTSKGFGTGLGLTLCKAILQRHDGDIRLLPQVKGCCFELVWTVKKIKI